MTDAEQHVTKLEGVVEGAKPHGKPKKAPKGTLAFTCLSSGFLTFPQRNKTRKKQSRLEAERRRWRVQL